MASEDPDHAPIRTIGWVGLGIMGAPMALRLVEAGYELTVTNRTRAKTEPLAAAGAAVVETPRELAAKRPDAILVNVTDTPDVEEVLFGPEGIAQDAAPGLIVVDHSTISPTATPKFANRLAEQDVVLLDAPVSGGDIGAQNGTLSIMVGGAQAAFERCRPVFDVLGKSAVLLGPSGSGQACKACNQVAVVGALVAVCESLALAKKCGLDLDLMIEVVSGGAGGSWQLANLGPKIARGDYAPGFMIDLLNKDLAIVASAAEELGLPLEVNRLIASYFQRASEEGHGRDGTQAVASVVEALGDFRYSSE